MCGKIKAFFNFPGFFANLLPGYLTKTFFWCKILMLFIWRRIEVVITGLTRNQLGLCPREFESRRLRQNREEPHCCAVLFVLPMKHTRKKAIWSPLKTSCERKWAVRAIFVVKPPRKAYSLTSSAFLESGTPCPFLLFTPVFRGSHIKIE